MSSPKTPARRLSLGALALSAILVTAAVAAGTASAATAPVKLKWDQVKVYESPQVVPNTNRTWLGYLARNGNSMAYARGTVTPTEGLEGPTVTPDSASGPTALYSWIFSSSAQAFNTAKFVGSFDFAGTLTYDSPPPPNGHGISISISSPKLVINPDGVSGSLLASGKGLGPANTGGPDYGAYAGTEVFKLDLSKATCKLSRHGSTTLEGIVPSLSAPGFFTASYAVGSGPERTPNTYGTFSASHVPCGAQSKIPVIGSTGTAAQTTTIKTTSKIFPRTKKTVVVKVTRKKKFIGYADVTGKTVRLNYVVKKINGTYRLSPIGSKQKKVSAKLS